MKKYKSYKNANLAWVEEIPESWALLKIGRTFSNIGSGTTPKSTDSRFYENGTINWLNTGDLNDDYIFETKKKVTSFVVECNSTLKLHLKDSIVIALYGATIGKLGHLKIEATTNQACCVLSNSDKVIQRFLFYYFLATREFIISKSYGGGQPNISQELIKQLYIPSPSIKEQSQIANYLDYKTTIIDALIEKKEQLIKKLQAQRQAIINEAVTKGLNKNAKMKNSGIEWLGEIPEHWSFINISFVAHSNRYSITGGPFGSDLKQEEYTDEGVRIIQLQNIGVGEFRNDYKIYTSEEKADELLSCNIYPGELIIAKMADPVARACIVPLFDRRYIMASDGIRFEVDENKCLTKFLEYAINSKYLNFQAELKSTGTTRLRIGLTEFKKFKLLLPDLKEQLQILSFIEDKGIKINKSVKLLKSQIKKLKSYRQSIISEAVTGKIDVRDWQAPKK